MPHTALVATPLRVLRTDELLLFVLTFFVSRVSKKGSSASSNAAFNHRIKYRLQRTLGPVNMPNQNIMLPSVARFRSHFVWLSLTNYERSR